MIWHLSPQALHWIPVLTPLMLLVPAVVLRLLPQRRTEDPRWLWGWDLLLLVLAAVGGGSLFAFWLHRAYMPAGSIAAADFGEYCDSLAALAPGTEARFSHLRSRVAAALPLLLLRREGVLDAFFLAGVVSLGVTVGGVFLWARALHGRLAGVTAALLTGTVAPMVLMSRHVSFYPEAMATFTLGAGLAALALRYPHPLTVLLSGMGAGLCLLVDLRGLVWALPFLGVTCLACLRLRRWRRLLGAILVGLPLVGAWELGPVAYSSETLCLEDQVNARKRFLERGFTDPVLYEVPNIEGCYVWGRSPVTDIPATLGHLWRERRIRPDDASLEPLIGPGRDREVTPWAAPVAVGLALALLGLRRRPWLLLGFAGTAMPFVATLGAAVTIQMSMARFLASSLPFVPVVLGIGWASTVQAPRFRPWVEPAPTLGTHLWWLGAVGIVAAVVLDVVPTHLSPTAPWRSHGQPEGGDEILQYVDAARAARPDPGLRIGCQNLMRAEARSGGPHLVTVYRRPVGSGSPPPPDR